MKKLFDVLRTMRILFLAVGVAFLCVSCGAAQNAVKAEPVKVDVGYTKEGPWGTTNYGHDLW